MDYPMHISKERYPAEEFEMQYGLQGISMIYKPPAGMSTGELEQTFQNSFGKFLKFVNNDESHFTSSELEDFARREPEFRQALSFINKLNDRLVEANPQLQ